MSLISQASAVRLDTGDLSSQGFCKKKKGATLAAQHLKQKEVQQWLLNR